MPAGRRRRAPLRKGVSSYSWSLWDVDSRRLVSGDRDSGLYRVELHGAVRLIRIIRRGLAGEGDRVGTGLQERELVIVWRLGGRHGHLRTERLVRIARRCAGIHIFRARDRAVVQ